MVYSLVSGVDNYNNRLHYSLYGGVEFLPDHTLAFKELLPLAAVPATAITLLVAILNFHIPKLAPQTGAGTTESKTTGTSLSVPGNGAGSSSQGQTTPRSSAATSRSGSTIPVSITPSPNVGPMSGGSDNGQGIIGGRGGDGAPTTNPTPATALGATTPVGSASVSTNATSKPTSSTSSVTVQTPVAGASTTISL